MSRWHAVTEAWRAVVRHPGRSTLSAASFAVGVFSVALLQGLVGGTSSSLQGEVVELGANIIDVLPGGDQDGSVTASSRVVSNPLTLEDAQLLGLHAGTLTDVSPVVVSSDTITTSGSRWSTEIVGVGPGFFELRYLPLREGRIITEADLQEQRNVAVIGHDVASSLFSEGEQVLGRHVSIGGEPFVVRGVLELRGRSLGVNLDDFVFVPASVALSLYELPGLTQILTASRPGIEADAATREIRRVLRRNHDDADYSVRTQEDVLDALGTVTSAMGALLGAVAAISLLAACLGIINLMLVVVVERRAEIGLRMAIGARAWDIGIQLLVETTLIAVTGGVLGLLVTFMTAPALEALDDSVKVHISWPSALFALGLSSLVGLVAGLVPALRSARVDPILALQVK